MLNQKFTSCKLSNPSTLQKWRLSSSGILYSLADTESDNDHFSYISDLDAVNSFVNDDVTNNVALDFHDLSVTDDKDEDGGHVEPATPTEKKAKM